MGYPPQSRSDTTGRLGLLGAELTVIRLRMALGVTLGTAIRLRMAVDGSGGLSSRSFSPLGRAVVVVIFSWPMTRATMFGGMPSSQLPGGLGAGSAPGGCQPLPFWYPFSHLIEACGSAHARQQLPPHDIQSLAHCEVQVSVHRARWPSQPEPPDPARRGTGPASAPLVRLVLPQYQDRAREQPHRLLFDEDLSRGFFTAELVYQLLALLREQPVPRLPEVTHGSPSRNRGRPAVAGAVMAGAPPFAVARQPAGLAAVVLWLDDRSVLVAAKKTTRKDLLATISKLGLAGVRT